MANTNDNADSAFQIVNLDDAVGASFLAASPAPAVAPVTSAAAPAGAGLPVVPPAGAVTAAVAPGRAVGPAPVAGVAGAPDGIAAPAAVPALLGPAFPFVSMDPAENRAGIALGVIPTQDLVYDPAVINNNASKYYAIARGRFIGIFCTNVMYDYAVRRVSGAVYWSPTELSVAIDWFNQQRVMGLCEIVA